MPRLGAAVGSCPAGDGAGRLSAARDVARAVDALRRGWAVSVDGLAVLAIETADEAALAAFDAAAPADILVSGNRAVTLKLANQVDGVPTGAVRIARPSWVGLTEATAIADPARDLRNPLKGPFRTAAAPEGADAALRLARSAGLLPALFICGDASQAAVTLGSASIYAAEADPKVRVAARAKLPVEGLDKSEIVAFRVEGDTSEHVALLIGEPNGAPPLVRLHSECLTGDVLGSLKCDCGPQLRDAIAAIGGSGWGILIYLRQEGRGIGLINKLRAYALQDQGYDTVDANLRLGFADDERDFTVAARMLAALGQDRVRLLSNNPRKAASLEAAGLSVEERVPLRSGLNPHNRDYLETKRRRSGHQL